MQNIVFSVGALIIGSVIGYFFGAIQNAALKRNTKMTEAKTLRSGWMVMPGSAGRIAILLMMLALIQIFFPMFFREGHLSQWLISVGVLLGYGKTLVDKLQQYQTYSA
jgi:hypothetical protein